ncbi:Serine/threonine-protein kinase B-raf [Leucoagaricus sp. SymC.cos]|nr:Serine/threonine-protein kinase B-raf [Leucoagaricus sp. SymC.cos]
MLHSNRSSGENISSFWGRLKLKSKETKRSSFTSARFLILVFADQESIRTLPETFAVSYSAFPPSALPCHPPQELKVLALGWIKPTESDAQFHFRVPVEYASIHAARVISGPYIYLTDETSYQLTAQGSHNLCVEVVPIVDSPYKSLKNGGNMDGASTQNDLKDERAKGFSPRNLLDATSQTHSLKPRAIDPLKDGDETFGYAINRQRPFLTLVYREQETLHLLPRTLSELEAQGRKWIKPPPDVQIFFRVPIEYAPIHAALLNEEAYEFTTSGVKSLLRVEIIIGIADRPSDPDSRLNSSIITKGDLESDTNDKGDEEPPDSDMQQSQQAISDQKVPESDRKSDISDPLPLNDGVDQTQVQVIEKLSQTLQDSESRKALRNLKDDRAQLMIDYMYSVLLEPALLPPGMRKYWLIALYKLSKASLLYPHCYFLKDITCNSQESCGGFSDIYKGRSGEQDLCLKVVRLYQKSHTDAMLKIYAKEAILWGQLHHANVVPFYGVYYLNEARKQVCLVSPWMQRGNLVDYLREHESISCYPFIYDTTAGLEYLHSQNIIHSDLKGMNVLVDDFQRACITDFGLALVRTDQTIEYTIASSTARGYSQHWAAPELLEDDASATLASDVWALGCVFYEVLTGTLPFQGLSNLQIMRRLSQGKLPTRPDSTSTTDQLVKDMWKIVGQCWEMEAEERPTCHQILEALQAKGLSRGHNSAAQDHVEREKLRFQEAMRKNEGPGVDLRLVRQVLDQVGNDVAAVSGLGHLCSFACHQL